MKFVDEKNYQEKILTKIVHHHIADKSLATRVSRILTRLGRSIEDGGGTLYSICIPKEKFSSMGYLATLFGCPIDRTYNPEELDSLQNGVFTYPKASFPQVRLLTKKLNMEEGVLIIPNSTLSEERIKEVEDRVEECLLQVKNYLS
jgi:hypothetical protein